MIKKLKDYIQNYNDTLNLEYKNAESSKISYLAGELNALYIILEWINNLPNEQKLDSIIKSVEDANAQEYYSYLSFSYIELKQLQKLYKLKEQNK